VEEDIGEVTITCPHCGATVDYVRKIQGRNHYMCPNCRKTIRKDLIPEGIRIEVIPMSERRKERLAQKQLLKEMLKGTVPGPEVLTLKKTEDIKKHEEEAPPEESIYERIRTPAEILTVVLKRYNVKPRCIEHLRAKAEMKGGLHPLELEERLNELSKSFTGIEDKRLIPDIVEDYMLMLQKEEEKARRRGIRYIVPTVMGRQSMPRQRFYGTGTVEMYPERATPHFYDRYSQYSPYSPYRPYEELPQQKALSKEDVLRMIMEWDRQREEKTKMDKLMDMIAEQQRIIAQLQAELKTLRENPPAAVPPDVVTKEEFERILSQRDKDAYQKYLEMQLQDTKEQINRLLESREKADEKWEQRLKEFQERYEKIIAKLEADYKEEREKLMKKIEEAKREAAIQGYKTDEARFRADVMKTVKEITSDVIEKAPLRKTLQITVAPIQERPPERRESKSSTEHEEVELPEEIFIESEEE